MVWASAGVGFVLLVAAGVVLKRRSGVTEFDDDEFGDSAGGNPFADLTPDSNESTPSFAEPAASDPAEATEPVPFGVSLAIDPAEATEPVPFGQPVDMGSELRDAVPTASSRLEKRKPLDLPIVAEVDSAGAGSAEIGILLKEIERRVAGIETRINELADGREQIERQVAAQTEELRVQRAAIARTQRAVRNMSRTDDAQATEPAPRDPRTA
jgi:hypothetical protein